MNSLYNCRCQQLQKRKFVSTASWWQHWCCERWGRRSPCFCLIKEAHVTIVCHSTYFKDCVLLVLKVKLSPSFPTRVCSCFPDWSRFMFIMKLLFANYRMKLSKALLHPAVLWFQLSNSFSQIDCALLSVLRCVSFVTVSSHSVPLLVYTHHGRSQPKTWGGVELEKFDFTIVLNERIMRKIAEYPS